MRPTEHPEVRRPHVASARLLLALVAGTLTACGPSPAPVPVPRNVVVILLDTLRADHLASYGYARSTAPFLERLAASHGVLFEDVASGAPATFPSVNSLFTSRRPGLFYRTSARDFGIPEHLTTVAEVFRSHGFRTGAVSPSPVVRKSPSYFNPDGGFGQGFEEFDESCGFAERHVPPFTAPCVTDRALALVDTFASRRFFLYVHYLDPHDPYRPPAAANVFAGEYHGIQAVAEGRTYPLTQSLLGIGEETLEITAADIRHLIDLYDGEIRAVDAEIRRLFDAFAARGLAEDTLFVFVSDHGESFLEHPGILQHGRSIYQSELRVLLMFYWTRGWASGLRRSDLACGVDVMPTILSLTRLPVPDGAQGAPLLGPGAGERKREEICLSVGRPDWRGRRASLLALRNGPLKILYARDRDRYEMYDLAADPGETRDLAPRPGEGPSPRFLALRSALQVLGERPGQDGENPVQLDPQAERALRALGYIQAPPAPGR